MFNGFSAVFNFFSVIATEERINEWEFQCRRRFYPWDVVMGNGESWWAVLIGNLTGLPLTEGRRVAGRCLASSAGVIR